MKKTRVVSEARGTIPNGKTVKLVADRYFSMISGSGLKWAFLDQTGQKAELYERMLNGDGSEPVGTIVVSNDTGSAVDYVFYTSSIYFDPKTMGATQNVKVIGQTGSLAVQGVDSDGAAATAKPVQGAGVDATGKVQTQLADVDGRQVVAPFSPLASLVDGEHTYAATGVQDVIAAPGASIRLVVGEITVTNTDTAAATALIYSGGTVKRRIRVPANDTRTVSFPAGFKLGANEALRADIAVNPAANPIYVAATAGQVG